jgi:hypothetical protein
MPKKTKHERKLEKIRKKMERVGLRQRLWDEIHGKGDYNKTKKKKKEYRRKLALGIVAAVKGVATFGSIKIQK